MRLTETLAVCLNDSLPVATFGAMTTIATHRIVVATGRLVSIGSHAASFTMSPLTLWAIGMHGAGASLFAPETRTFGPEAAHRLVLTMPT